MSTRHPQALSILDNIESIFAASIGCESRRVQFMPDILLADEINRAPPKTQSARLEAMEERHVTIEGDTMRLDTPFFVLATQNPLEQEGAYPLPEAQMNRFLLRLSTGYPRDLDRETEILERRVSWHKDDPPGDIRPAVTRDEFRAMQAHVEDGVFVDKEVLRYMS